MFINEGQWPSAGLSEYTRIDIRDHTINFSLTMTPELEKYNGYSLVYW